MRYVDRTKKSNIKCEHCVYADRPTEPLENYHCSLHQKTVNYWNRCKAFRWDNDRCPVSDEQYLLG